MTKTASLLFGFLLLAPPGSTYAALPFGGIPGAELQRLIQQASSKAVSVASERKPADTIPHKAVYQYGLASIVVGVSSKGLHVGYRLEILAAVPGNVTDADLGRIRSATPPLIASTVQEFVQQLDALPGLEDPAATTPKPGETTEQHFTAYANDINNRVHALFLAATKKFSTQFGKQFPNYAASSFLAVGLRPCVEPACPLTHEGRVKGRFGKVYGWMRAQGLAKVNQAYILSPQGTFVSLTTSLQEHKWQAEISESVLQSALINAANQARRTQESLSYSAAEFAKLPRETVAHIADTFDSAYAAAVPLRTDPTAVLRGISDELGRARLTECVRLRGTFDAADAGTCSGYRLSPQIVTQCLSGKDCVPPFGAQVNLDSLMLNAHTRLADFAQNAPLPRVVLGSFDQLGTVVNQCKERTGTDLEYCVVKSSLGRNAQTTKTLECIESSQAHGAGALIHCAAVGLPREQQAQIACMKDNSSEYKKLAICAAAPALPPQAQKLIVCANDMSSSHSSSADVAACVGAATGSREAACVAKHRNDWQAAALCIAGDKLPPQVNNALGCAQSATTLSGLGVCMVAKEGSGEAQRIAECYVEGQGVPAAIAVCLASKNLTLDQRIVLECAAETDGALPATAVCTGGKMLMRDLNDCHGQKFGEGKCFGEGNEIRKLAKNLGFPIGPHSVVADVMNVQLRIADATTTPILNTGAQAVTQFMEFGERTGITHDIRDPMAAVGGPVGKLVENYCDHNPCPHF